MSRPNMPTSSRLSTAQGLLRLYSSCVGRKATSHGIRKPVRAAAKVASPLQVRYLQCGTAAGAVGGLDAEAGGSRWWT